MQAYFVVVAKMNLYCKIILHNNKIDISSEKMTEFLDLHLIENRKSD
jgi:hypothetical protein